MKKLTPKDKTINELTEDYFLTAIQKKGFLIVSALSNNTISRDKQQKSYSSCRAFNSPLINSTRRLRCTSFITARQTNNSLSPILSSKNCYNHSPTLV